MAEEHVRITAVEMWLIRILGACLIAGIGWIGLQFQTMIVHVAEIRKELDIVKPADVLAAVQQLEKISLTPKEVESIIVSKAPWNQVKTEWNEWRYISDHRLQDIEIELRERTKDRWTKTDQELYMREFQRLNPELKLPK